MRAVKKKPSAIRNSLANSFSSNSQGSTSRVALNNVFHLTGNLLQFQRKYLRALSHSPLLALPRPRAAAAVSRDANMSSLRAPSSSPSYILFSPPSHSFLAQYLQIPESALLLFPRLLPSPPLPSPLTSTSVVQSVPSVFITLLTQIKGVTGDVRNVAALSRLD